MNQLDYQRKVIREELIEKKNLDDNVSKNKEVLMPRSKRMARFLANMESRR